MILGKHQANETRTLFIVLNTLLVVPVLLILSVGSRYFKEVKSHGELNITSTTGNAINAAAVINGAGLKEWERIIVKLVVL